MKIIVGGIKGQTVDIKLISPGSIRTVSLNNKMGAYIVSSLKDENIYTSSLKFLLVEPESEILINF
jgi:hypothetical protein